MTSELSEKYHGKAGGRICTPLENKVWEEYEAVLDKYHEKYKVRWYDRPSVHDAFPEIKAAFDKYRSLSVYYKLRGGVKDKDYERR